MLVCLLMYGYVLQCNIVKINNKANLVKVQELKYNNNIFYWANTSVYNGYCKL